MWVEPHPSLVTLWGRVFVPADRVDVQLGDGLTLTLPVVEGVFLGSPDRGAKVAQIAAYDAADNEVATVSRPS